MTTLPSFATGLLLGVSPPRVLTLRVGITFPLIDTFSLVTFIYPVIELIYPWLPLFTLWLYLFTLGCIYLPCDCTYFPVVALTYILFFGVRNETNPLLISNQ